MSLVGPGLSARQLCTGSPFLGEDVNEERDLSPQVGQARNQGSLGACFVSCEIAWLIGRMDPLPKLCRTSLGANCALVCSFGMFGIPGRVLQQAEHVTCQWDLRYPACRLFWEPWLGSVALPFTELQLLTRQCFHLPVSV